MTCEEIDEALAAYVVSALDAQETIDVCGHLNTCRRHDGLLAMLLASVEALPLAVPERDPPASLRARILTAFDTEVAGRQPAAPAAVTRLPRTPRWHRPRPALAWLAAAALLLAVAGLATWNAVLLLGGEEEPTLVARFAGTSGSGQVVYLEDEHLALLSVDLPAPPAGHVYQAWGMQETGPVSIGFLPNHGAAVLDADLSGANAVAISVEPEGGSPQPTTEPVLVAKLR